jgi:hypothetical protein
MRGDVLLAQKEYAGASAHGLAGGSPFWAALDPSWERVAGTGGVAAALILWTCLRRA